MFGCIGLFQKISTHTPWTTLEILQEMLGEYDWKSTNFPKILQILTGIPGKPFKFLRNSGIFQDFESAGSGILQKLQLSFLEILKILGTQFSVVHGGGIFSGIAHSCILPYFAFFYFYTTKDWEPGGFHLLPSFQILSSSPCLGLIIFYT